MQPTESPPPQQLPSLGAKADPPPSVAAAMQPPDWACPTDEQVIRIDARSQNQAKRVNRMRKLVIAASRAIQTDLQRGGFRFRCAMITLTYRPEEQWQPKQIARLMACYRSWLKRRGVPLQGVWVLELTKRGKPHYHLLLWLPKGLTPPKPDKQGWWPHGMTNCTWARSPVGYAAKYASKDETKSGPMPKGARMFGVYGVPLHLGHWRAPGWMQKLSKPGDKVNCRKGGWWVNHSSGWGFRSPWQMDYIEGPDIVISWRGWPGGSVRSAWEIMAIEESAK